MSIDQLQKQIDKLQSEGQYAAAIDQAQAAIRQLGQDNPAAVDLIVRLGGLYRLIGRYDQARPLLAWALQIKEQAAAPDSLEAAGILHELGQTDLALNNQTLAEKHFKRALEIRQAAHPPEHPDVAESQHDLGELHLVRGDYDQAGRFFEAAWRIRQAVFDPDQPALAQSLLALGRLDYARGLYPQAGDRYRQALDIQRHALGRQHPLTGHTLGHLARLAHTLGQYAAAERDYKAALDIQARSTGVQQPAYAAALDRLGALYLEMGRYDQAEQQYRQALRIRQSHWHDQHPEFAASLENLGRLHRTRSQAAESRRLLQWALQIKRKALPPGHPGLAVALDELAQTAQTLGQYGRAETLLQEALAIRQSALGDDHLEVAASQYHLARLYHALGDCNRAELRYQQARQRRLERLGPAHPDLAAALDGLARLYHTLMADLEQAQPLLEQALQIREAAFGPDHPACAQSRYHLAQLYLDQESPARARPLLEQALASQQQHLGRQHPDTARTLVALAGSLRAMGDDAAAEPLYHQAQQIWQASGGDSHPDFAQGLYHLARLYQDRGSFDQARRLYQWALQIQQAVFGEAHPAVVDTLNGLAAVYTALDLTGPAFDSFEKAATIYEQLIGAVFTTGTERQRLLYVVSLRRHLALYLSFLVRRRADLPQAVQAGLTLVLRRKALSAEVLAVQRDAILGNQYPELQPQLAQLTDLRQRLGQKMLAGPGPEGGTLHRQLLADWQQQREQIERGLARQIPAMDLAGQLRTVGPDQVLAVLPTGVALVEFVHTRPFDFEAAPAQGQPQWRPARYLAFVLHHGGMALVDLGEAAAIDQHVAGLRSIITGDDEAQRGLFFGGEADPQTPADLEAGRKLRALIFDPLRPALDGCQRLFIAPDGDLNRLPFEILPDEDGQRLIDIYRISYLSAGRDLLRFGKAGGGQPAEPLVVANPDFDLAAGHSSDDRSQTSESRLQIETGDSSESTAAGLEAQRTVAAGTGQTRLHFGPLPGTRREGEQVAELLGVSPLLADAALEAHIKTAASPRILHIASHGFFLPNQPQASETGAWGRLSHALANPLLCSGLALAGVNTWLKGDDLPPEAEDGLLTAEDVTGLDLLATELVVLSACETGLGQVQAGEGVFGLRRAFVLAGAKTLVMSLWQVPDQQTQQLMTDFYRRILAGEPRAEALRQAQLALKKWYPDPFYWGAFICQGQPGPLEGMRR